MPRTTSFTLSEELDDYITEKVRAGQATSASELIRQAVTRMKEQDDREAWVLKQLDEAAASTARYTHDEVWRRRRKVG